MDLKVVKKLIQYLKSNGLSEITYRSGNDEITLKQELKNPAQPNPDLVSQTPPPAAKSASAETQADNVIKAPLVGVFYAAKSPDEAPFIAVGDHIKAGDSIGIIEAMKVMTPIKADRSGVVTKVLVADGEEVEYDEPLIQVK